MYLSPTEVCETRSSTLDNFLALSCACFEAGDRWATLVARGSYQAIAQACAAGDGQPEGGADLLEDSLGIFGDVHAALLQAAATQVELFDSVVLRTIDRAARSAPWEGVVAIAALRTVLLAAETTIHSVNETAIQTLAIAGNEAHTIARQAARAALPPPPG